VELKPERTPDGAVLLGFDLEAHGYGAFFASSAAPDANIEALMSKMRVMTATPLNAYSHEWKVLPQQIVPIDAVKAPPTPPADMVKTRQCADSVLPSFPQAGIHDGPPPSRG
jgi:hypothetical protein